MHTQVWLQKLLLGARETNALFRIWNVPDRWLLFETMVMCVINTGGVLQHAIQCTSLVKAAGASLQLEKHKQNYRVFECLVGKKDKAQIVLSKTEGMQ